MIMLFLMVFSSMLSFVVCLPFNNNVYLGYEYLWVLPLSFAFTYFFIYRVVLKRKSMRITTYIIIFISWIRCVITPLSGSISGYYNNLGVMATVESTQIATVMVAYEQLFIGALLFLYYCKRQNDLQDKLDSNARLEDDVKLEGNKGIYAVYITFAFAVFVVIGRHLNLFEFLIISTEEETRIGDITDTSTIAIRQIISSGMIFLFLLIAEKSRRIYGKTEKDVYINYALMAALLFVCIIVGERRSSQVYIAFATSWVLMRVFPFKQKKIATTIMSGAVLVIVLMTIYKSFNAFLHGSYVTALSESNINIHWFAQMMDSYFFGIRVVASNIAYSDISQINIVNMLYDFARSTFGLSFFLKEDMVTTSELYNLTIYNGGQSSGHLFSSIGYGSAYLGYILAPMITWFNVYIALKLEWWMRRSKSIEMNFILSYIFMRFAFGLFSNPAPLINSGSRYLILNGLIFVGAVLFINRKKTVNLTKKHYTLKRRESVT